MLLNNEVTLLVIIAVGCLLPMHLSTRQHTARKSSISKVSSDRGFFVTTVQGLEGILASEISSLSGITSVSKGKCGVKYRGNIVSGMEAVLKLRTALRVMEKIVEVDNINSKEDLYRMCATIDWTSMIGPEATIKCDTTLGQASSSELAHSHFTSLTIKNAIIDQFRESQGVRPNVDVHDPDLLLQLYLHRGKATLYRVWSGERSMHKRGYRGDTIHKAALRETTAAAL